MALPAPTRIATMRPWTTIPMSTAIPRASLEAIVERGDGAAVGLGLRAVNIDIGAAVVVAGGLFDVTGGPLGREITLVQKRPGGDVVDGVMEIGATANETFDFGAYLFESGRQYLHQPLGVGFADGVGVAAGFLAHDCVEE